MRWSWLRIKSNQSATRLCNTNHRSNPVATRLPRSSCSSWDFNPCSQKFCNCAVAKVSNDSRLFFWKGLFLRLRASFLRIQILKRFITKNKTVVENALTFAKFCATGLCGKKKEWSRHEGLWKRPIFRLYITEGARLVANVQIFFSWSWFRRTQFLQLITFLQTFLFTYVALPVAPTASVGITRLRKQSFSPSTDL